MLETITVSDQSKMQAYIARGTPKIAGSKLPGIILLQEAFGVNSHIQKLADRIALEGYVVYAPELYHRSAAPGFTCGYTEFMSAALPHYEKVTTETLTLDLTACFQAMKQDPAIDPSRIMSLGYCMGGKASFFANSILPLSAAVSFYGGGIADTLLDRAAHQQGPVLLIWAGKDTHIGTEKQHAISNALRASQKKFIEIEFSHAEHGFFCDERAAYNEEAATIAYTILLQFLKSNSEIVPH